MNFEESSSLQKATLPSIIYHRHCSSLAWFNFVDGRSDSKHQGRMNHQRQVRTEDELLSFYRQAPKICVTNQCNKGSMHPDSTSYRKYGLPLNDVAEIVNEIQRKQDTIQTITLYDIELPADYPEFYLDPLLQRIAMVPNLQCFDSSVRTWDKEDHSIRRPLVKPETLRRFLELSCNLIEVSLWNWNLRDEHFVKGLIPGLLSFTSNIQFLSLRRNPCISSVAWRYLYEIAEAKNELAYIMSDTTYIPSERQLFYLDLNRKGRGSILARKDRNTLSVLEKSSRAPDSLYYWVQQLVPCLLASHAINA